MEEMANVNIEYLINTLEQKKVSVVTRKKHSYIMYQGIESEYIYVLKDGVAKISNILRDGREFNIAYVAQPDFVSLLEEKQNDTIFERGAKVVQEFLDNLKDEVKKVLNSIF